MPQSAPLVKTPFRPRGARITMKAKITKRTWALAALLLVCIGAAIWSFAPRDPLADLKESKTAAITPEIREAVDKVLALIEQNDMNGLFQSMFNNKDGIDFNILYRQGLFSEKAGPFCPARIVGATGKSLVHSSLKNIRVIVHSEPRNADYQVNLVYHRDAYRVADILPAHSNPGEPLQ